MQQSLNRRRKNRRVALQTSETPPKPADTAPGGALHAFFFGKNDSLIQDLFSKFVGAAFSGLIIAGAAVFVLSRIETAIEVAQKRNAFAATQNAIRDQTINDVTTAKIAIGCVHDRLKLPQSTCADTLADWLVLVRSRRSLHDTFQLGAAAEFNGMIAATEALASVAGRGPIAANADTRLDEFNARFKALIKAIADGYS